MGVIMSLLMGGIFELINGVTILLGWTYQAWIGAGIVMTALGAYWTLREYVGPAASPSDREDDGLPHAEPVQ